MTIKTLRRSADNMTDEEKAELAKLWANGSGALPTKPNTVAFLMSGTVGAAAEWLVARIKETNGHQRYAVGLIAHVGRFDDPIEGANLLFQWWMAERVPKMLEGEVVDAADGRKTITIAAARRLLEFVTEHYPADIKSEYAPGMTYEQGVRVMGMYLKWYNDGAAAIAPKLAHEIQAFCGVAFDERVRDPSE